jgi:outer membrane receptor protein involved in Fe transport
MWLLVPNAPLLDNSKDVMFDVQHNFYLRNNIHFIWGITEQLQYIRTYGTSIPNNVDADFTGVYSQIEWQAADNLKLVGSARYDHASIHPSYFSPRFSVVYSPIAGNQFRLSINKGFQRPNYSELYRLTPDAPAFSTKTKAPVNFKNIEKIIADSIASLSGVRPEINLNLSPTRAFAVGNDKLEVEKITSFEFGYKNTISDNFYISVDLFYNRLTDFITIFCIGVNPNNQKWSPQLPDSFRHTLNWFRTLFDSTFSKRLSKIIYI